MKRSSHLFLAGLAVVFLAGRQPAADAGPADTSARPLTGNCQLVEKWITGAPKDVGGVSGVTVDADGNVYAFRRMDAGNPTGGDVWIIDPTGKFVESWGQDIANPTAT